MTERLKRGTGRPEPGGTSKDTSPTRKSPQRANGEASGAETPPAGQGFGMTAKTAAEALANFGQAIKMFGNMTSPSLAAAARKIGEDIEAEILSAEPEPIDWTGDLPIKPEVPRFLTIVFSGREIRSAVDPEAMIRHRLKNEGGFDLSRPMEREDDALADRITFRQRIK